MCCYVCCLLCLIALISPVLPQEQSQSDLRLIYSSRNSDFKHCSAKKKCAWSVEGCWTANPGVFNISPMSNHIFLIGFNTGGFLKYGDPYILVSLYLCIFSTKPYGWWGYPLILVPTSIITGAGDWWEPLPSRNTKQQWDARTARSGLPTKECGDLINHQRQPFLRFWGFWALLMFIIVYSFKNPPDIQGRQ